MFAILPVFCFVLAFFILLRHYKLEWRSAFLSSSVLWGILVVILTEGLSLFDLLSFLPLTVMWVIICMLLVVIVFYFRLLSDFNVSWRISISRFEYVILAYLSALAIVIGVIAWVAPPNTWDSMTYHMSRVVHWIQNKSVAFYPTHDLRHLYLSPWSEFAISHFQILSGGDYLANFIQWFSMVGSMIGVSLIAQELGSNVRGQFFSAVVSATIPMGILQGSSTQNDYVVAFWLVCFVYFSMRFVKNTDLHRAMGVGMALGLAILTKATAYVFAFPFLLWAVYSIMCNRLKYQKKIFYLAVALLFVFGANMGHYARNYNLFGSPLGPDSTALTNRMFTFSSVTSNLIRNIGLHINTPFAQINTALEKSIFNFHEFIGISPSDARTTYAGAEFHIMFVYLHEDLAGNLIHLSLVLVTLVLYFWRYREKREIFYIISIFTGFLFFSAYLKWQPWNSRLHLPWFVLSSPFVGLILSRIQTRFVANLIIVLLMVAALPWLLFNTSRPLFRKESTVASFFRIEQNTMNPWGNEGIFFTTRVEKYFNNRAELAEPYRKAVKKISRLGCSNVGLIIGEDGWEYPIWVLLREKMGDQVFLSPVNVFNISQQIYTSNKYSASPSACAILFIYGELPATLSVGNITYSKDWSYETSQNNIGIFIPFIEQK